MAPSLLAVPVSMPHPTRPDAGSAKSFRPLGMIPRRSGQSHSLEYDPSTKCGSLRRCATHLGWFFSNSGLWPSNDWWSSWKGTNKTFELKFKMVAFKTSALRFGDTETRHRSGVNKLTPVFVGSRPDWTHKQCTSSNEHPPPPPPSYWKLNWQCDGTLSPWKKWGDI